MSTTPVEKKPRLTTSARVASIASEGQKVKAAPFGISREALGTRIKGWLA